VPTRNLYFDESGFTGYNLLDPQQPVFCIASTDIGPDEAQAILRESFPRYQGQEYKFQNIWGSNRHRRGLETFARLMEPHAERALVWRTDKPFAVFTKIVDFLIEPVIHAAGFDFYADGFCWKYANYIYYALKEFGEPGLYETIITTYQQFSREPTRENLEAMQRQYRTMADSLDEPLQMFLEQMALGAENFERFSSLDTFTGTDELYVSTMMAIVAHWRNRTEDEFAIFHDDSAHFFRQREMWNLLTRADAPEGVHRAGDGARVQFPMGVTSTTATNSRDSSAIQLCDVIAGFSAKIFDEQVVGDDRALLERVVEGGLQNLTFNGVRAAAVFPDQIPPRRLEGPDAVDRLAAVLARRDVE
jgi:hypothetical protein